MKKITTIALWFCFALPTLLFGQGEASNWYFGEGAGLTFNANGTVTQKTDGQLNTLEGCSSISDAAGSLLFYTDGIIVYNQDHEVMENGNKLFGDSSSTQSTIIIPKPGNPDLFYVVTVDTKVDATDTDLGLNYSIVDITKNNGNGAVVEKNLPLLDDCSEKIAAVVKDCLDESLWLVTLSTIDGASGLFNTFHAFEINESGISPSSVKSTFDDIQIEDPRGYLKLSNDGTRMASANMSSGLYLYDFDPKTGVASNQQKITVPSSINAAYGIEFSPNGRYLYVHASNDHNPQEQTGHFSTLYQFDLLADDISASNVLLDSRPIYRGALQLGENGKIYRTIAQSYTVGSSYLGVINNPDNSGSEADYKHNAIYLGKGKANQGLPPFVQSFFNKINLLSNDAGVEISGIELCSGNSFELLTEDIPNATFLWTKDGIPFNNPLRNEFKVSNATIDDAGRYRLEIISNDPLECPIVGEALIEISPLLQADDTKLTQCDIDENSNDGYAIFDLEQVNPDGEFDIFFYESLEDSQNGIPIENPRNYTNKEPLSQKVYYKLVNDIGCEDSGEITLQVNSVPIVESPVGSIYECAIDNSDDALLGSFDLDEIRENYYPNSIVAFYDNLENVSLEQNALNGELITTNTTLYVRVEDGFECKSVELLPLVVNPLPELKFQQEQRVCVNGEPIELIAPDGFDYYRWYRVEGSEITEISSDIRATIFKAGLYNLEVGTKNESGAKTLVCSTNTDFKVEASESALIEEINVSNKLKDNTVAVLVSGSGNYEYSIDGELYQESNTFENVDGGFYTVYVKDKNNCGIVEEKIGVLGYPKWFTPNGDGMNDQWQLIGLDNQNVTVRIFNRYGKLLKQINSDITGWDGTYNGKQLPPTDYWFKVSFEDGNEFNGHFALKN